MVNILSETAVVHESALPSYFMFTLSEPICSGDTDVSRPLRKRAVFSGERQNTILNARGVFLPLMHS